MTRLATDKTQYEIWYSWAKLCLNCGTSAAGLVQMLATIRVYRNEHSLRIALPVLLVIRILETILFNLVPLFYHKPGNDLQGELHFFLGWKTKKQIAKVDRYLKYFSSLALGLCLTVVCFTAWARHKRDFLALGIGGACLADLLAAGVVVALDECRGIENRRFMPAFGDEEFAAEELGAGYDDESQELEMAYGHSHTMKVKASAASQHGQHGQLLGQKSRPYGGSADDAHEDGHSTPVRVYHPDDDRQQD